MWSYAFCFMMYLCGRNSLCKSFFNFFSAIVVKRQYCGHVHHVKHSCTIQLPLLPILTLFIPIISHSLLYVPICGNIYLVRRRIVCRQTYSNLQVTTWCRRSSSVARNYLRFPLSFSGVIPRLIWLVFYY